MKTVLPNKIETVDQAKQLLTDLHNNGESFHPEDNPMDCLSGITDEEGEKLNQLMNEIYLLPGNEHYQNMIFDPCEFLLNLDPEYKID